MRPVRHTGLHQSFNTVSWGHEASQVHRVTSELTQLVSWGVWLSNVGFTCDTLKRWFYLWLTLERWFYQWLTLEWWFYLWLTLERWFYLRLRSDVEQVEAVDVGRYPSLPCLVTKHPWPPALGELGVLVVQVLCEITAVLLLTGPWWGVEVWAQWKVRSLLWESIIIIK